MNCYCNNCRSLGPGPSVEEPKGNHFLPAPRQQGMIGESQSVPKPELVYGAYIEINEGALTLVSVHRTQQGAQKSAALYDGHVKPFWLLP